ncbi:MAG: hypothetical protein AB7S81_02630 [Bdellovibrionales bacterium]
MIFAELQNLYGPYVAERVRQGLTLRVFEELEIEELVHYFELQAARSYEEYQRRLNDELPANAPVTSKEEYLEILRRRWQDSEELAHLVLNAELEQEQDEAGGLRA